MGNAFTGWEHTGEGVWQRELPDSSMLRVMKRQNTGPECNGICVWAHELIDCAPNMVAYPHPDCPLHGGAPTDEEADMADPIEQEPSILQQYAIEWVIPKSVSGQEHSVVISYRAPTHSQQRERIRGVYVVQFVGQGNMHGLRKDGTWDYMYSERFASPEEALQLLLATPHLPYSRTRGEG